MNSRTAVVVVGVMGLAASLLAQGPRRDGKWEVKVEMQMPGMTMPAQTVTQCVTKDEAADPLKAMPQRGRGGDSSDCKVSDYKVDGNKVSWSMACAKDKMTGTGEFVYAGETYTGSMIMNTQGQTMTMKYSGKRLGDCTK